MDQVRIKYKIEIKGFVKSALKLHYKIINAEKIVHYFENFENILDIHNHNDLKNAIEYSNNNKYKMLYECIVVEKAI